MTSQFEAPLLGLLSDRTGHLAGLYLHLHNTDLATLERLTEASPLAALAARLPCVFDAQPHPELNTALQALGARPLLTEQLAAENARPMDPASPQTQWWPGHWYLQAPAQGVHTQSASRAMALKLMQLVAADADTRELEDIFRREPTLSYHLLRLVNSVGMGLNRKITSFSQAIILVGREQLRRWLNFILFAARNDDPRSAMLLARVAARARCMELIAKAVGRDRAQQELAFMSGMFSMLGVLFGQPLAQALQPLKLGEDVLAAVIDYQGWLGELLALVEAAEYRTIARIVPALTALGLSAAQFSAIHLHAHQWMLDVVHEGGNHG